MVISFNTGKVETTGGSGTGLLQQKKVTVTENGLDVVVPDAGYDGLSTVYVKTYVSNDSGMKDFSVLGYDEELNILLNEGIDADIAYSKKFLDNWKIPNSAPNIYNNQDIVYCPVINLQDSSYGWLTFTIEQCKNLEIIPDLDLQGLSSFELKNLPALSHIGISNWKMYDRTNVVKFYSCNKLKTLDLSTLNTTNITNMSEMFYGCYLLTDIKGIEDWDVSNVTNMSKMFYNCYVLPSIDFGSWNTSNVTNMYRMFYGCSGITSLDLSSWDVSNVTDMSDMFNGCSGITSLDLSSWDVTKVNIFTNMFSYCKSLKDLDISGWNMGLVKDGYYLPSFSNSSNLENLIFGFDRKVNISFSQNPKLTLDSLLSIINGLYDFVGNSMTPTSTQGKLTLGSTNLAKLTDEQKAIATAKGWTLA